MQVHVVLVSCFGLAIRYSLVRLEKILEVEEHVQQLEHIRDPPCFLHSVINFSGITSLPLNLITLVQLHHAGDGEVVVFGRSSISSRISLHHIQRIAAPTLTAVSCKGLMPRPQLARDDSCEEEDDNEDKAAEEGLRATTHHLSVSRFSRSCTRRRRRSSGFC